MIGQVLNGTYRLTDVLGSGGYADVYLARDLRTDTVVAIKILRPHVAQNPDVAARFEREASLARRLQTPHVARILDAGQDGTSPFIVMELVQGLTVSELIRRNGPFPIADAVDVVDQLLNALGSAHALGIIHRDVKPQNLMLDAERRLKVLDFGVARVAGAGSMTASGHLLGTPEYMSAEQVAGGQIDHRTDLYAAGAVLYQLLSGRAPFLRFSGTEVWELIRRVQRDQPPPIRQLRPEVTPDLAAVLERSMAKDPDQRFQTAYEMRLALAGAIGKEPPAPQPPPATMPPPGATQVMPVPNVAGASQPATQAMPAVGAATPVAGQHGSGQPGQTPSPPPGRGAGSFPPPPGGSRAYTPTPPMPKDPSARREQLATWKIVAWAVAALVLVIVGVAVGRILPLPGGSVTPTPTTTRAGAPATPMASPTAAAGGAQVASPVSSPVAAVTASPVALANSTPPAASPTVPPRPTNVPGVLLADTFENAEIGQLPRVSARPNDYIFAYDHGEYVINKINAALPAAPIVFLPGTYDNTVIGVDVRIAGDATSRYAFVVCRDQSSGGQAKQYRASIVPDGRRLILSRWDDGTQRVLSEVRDNAAISPGNGTNRLELRCAGTKISAFVNGQMLASADDMTLNRGDQGLGAGTFAGVDGTLEARFDNLEIRQP
jgi:serine/threonine protein kinase